MVRSDDVARVIAFCFKQLGIVHVPKDALCNIVYLAQCYHIKKTGVPLFYEPMMILDEGFATMMVLNSEFDGEYDDTVERLSVFQVDLISDVAIRYSGKTWKQIADEVRSHASWRSDLVEVPFDELKDAADRLDNIELKLSPSQVGYIDEEGYTVLPKEEDWI